MKKFSIIWNLYAPNDPRPLRVRENKKFNSLAEAREYCEFSRREMPGQADGLVSCRQYHFKKAVK